VGRGSVIGHREGEARLTGRVAGHTEHWDVEVRRPGLEIGLPSALIVSGEMVRLEAHYSDTGGRTLGFAQEVTWESLSPDVVAIRDGMLIAHGIGEATLVARSGALEARQSIHVLGDLLVEVREGRNSYIRTLDLEDGTLHELPAGSPRGSEPTVSPRGDWIAFTAGSRWRPRIHMMRPDGSELHQPTLKLDESFGAPFGLYREHRPVFSLDGNTLYFLANPRGPYHVFALELEIGEVTPLVDGSYHIRSIAVDRFSGDLIMERTRGSAASDILSMRADGTGLTRIFDGSDPSLRPFLFQDPIPVGEDGAMVTQRTHTILPREGNAISIVHPLSTERTNPTASVVPAERDRQLRLSASASGRYLAFIRSPGPGRGAPRINLFSMERSTVRPVEVEGGAEIVDLTWIGERNQTLARIVR
jgi:hypothetical protein